MLRLISILFIASTFTLLNAAEQDYVWQEAQAKRLPGGLLEWTPKPFTFNKGESQRYIDYESGDDNADGTSKASPWKHHPWDKNAGGKAKACTGIHTYVFKRGVTYRGSLVADDSGSEASPIRLSSDPSWGKGNASFSGARQIKTQWKKVNNAPSGMPSSDKVWVADTQGFQRITALWSHGKNIERIKLARHPNWTLSNKDDVKAEWATWDKTWRAPKQKRTFLPNAQLGNDRVICQSKEILNEQNANAYNGATVWTEYTGLMGSPYPGPVLNFDPAKNTIMVGAPWMGQNFPIENCRFFLENHPRFLDEAGEYWHDTKNNKLYLRLHDDSDPNKAQVEASAEITLIDVSNQSHIHISGLHFQHQRVFQIHKRFWDVPEEDGACIKGIGSSVNIQISNNTFTDIVRGVWFQGTQPTDAIHNIVIQDNEMRNCDWDCIIIYPSKGTKGNMGTIQVLRNKMQEIGERPRRAAHGHAIQVRYARQLILAGNFINRSFGTAIFLHGGKPSSRGGKGGSEDAKLCRMLVFDNQVEDTYMTNNDWGGIETWQGGPAYVYNNVSLRPHGYWHSPNQITNENWKEYNDRWNREYPHKDFNMLSKTRSVAGMWTRNKRNACSAGFTYAYYHDGGSKQYLFNNIGVGRSSDLNSALLTTGAVHAVGGCFLLSTFNNTFYKFGVGYQRHGTYPGTDLFLGNIFEDIGDMFLRLGTPRANPKDNAKHLPDADPESGKAGADSPTLLQALNNNIFVGNPPHFGVIEESGQMRDTFDAWKQALQSLHAIDASSGTHVQSSVLRDPENNDFRPKPGSAAEKAAVKTFVPWGLSATVGEWHFRLIDNEVNRVIDEHWYMDPSHIDRGMYRRVVRHNLYGENIQADTFINGPSENWRTSAVSLNGTNQSFSVSNRIMKMDVSYKDRKKQVTIPATEKRTLDIDTQNLLIELTASFSSTSGGICGKVQGNGYALDLDNGKPRLQLFIDGKVMASATAKQSINDKAWHHLLVEVDRKNQSIQFYLNGKKVESTKTGNVSNASLSNAGDFLVGKDHQGNYAAMQLDFLRVCQGTLADAETSIDELYAWQTQGPFLRTLFGKQIK